MRLPVAMMFLAVLLPTLWEAGDSPPAARTSERAVAIFDPDSAHIWNRLYAALWVREDRQGTQYGADSLDPPLWYETEHLLAAPSHARAIRVLDEFVQTHAENLIRDPLKRAILQRDLWAVFDWSVRQSSASQRPEYDKEKQELQTRLAETLKRVALSPKEIESLPDNYAQAVASGAFATEYDPAHRERAFLPPDLFDPKGPWFLLDNRGNLEPFASAHIFAFSGRSSFFVFVRLPGGRKAAVDYLQALWNFPEPWVHGGALASDDQASINPVLPSFPAGTEVALLRQLTLFDNQGNLVSSSIIESVQMRVYHEITTTPERYFAGSEADVARNSGQDFYQFTLSRPLLFANKTGGLRATGRDERELFTFQQEGSDWIDEISEKPELKKTWPTALQSCLSCHSGGGVQSLNSREKLLKPNRRQQSDTGTAAYPPRWWVNFGTAYWKRDRYDWGLLNGYWKAADRPH